MKSLSHVWLFVTPWTVAHQAATAKSLQSCPTLCDPIDRSPPGPAVPGILQARTLEWVAISFSNAWKWKVKVKLLSCIRLLATSWTAAYQAPPSVGFSRQEYWSGVPTRLLVSKYPLNRKCKRSKEGIDNGYNIPPSIGQIVILFLSGLSLKPVQ